MASFISSSASSTIAGLVSLTFGFGSSILVARMLGAEGTGSVAFALWIAMTAATLANLGVPSVLLRYMPTYDRPGNPGGGLTWLLLPYFTVPLLLTAVGMIGYAFWVEFFVSNPDYTSAIWTMTALLFVVYSTASLAEGAARGLNRFNETAKLTFYGCLLQVPMIALGGLLFGVPGAIAGYVVRHLPQAIRLKFYLKNRPVSEASVLGKMKAYGRNTWFSNATGMLVWSRAEFLFIGVYFTTTEIGYYAAGLTLAGLVVQLPTQMTAAVTPHIGAHHDQGQTERIVRTYHRVMRWLSLIIFPICFGGAAIMGELIPVLFGPDFTAAISMDRVLVLFAFLTALSLVPSTMISACERSDFYLYASPIMAVVSLASFAAIVPFTGGLGAAWVRTAVHGAWLVWLIIFCWKRLGLRLNIGDLLRIGLAAGLCAGAAYSTLFWIQGFLGMSTAVLLGALVYAIALRLLRVIPLEDIVALMNNLPSALPSSATHITYQALMLLAAPSTVKKA
jgi:O-antigen/teichoic acid export membrane protein